MAITRPWGRRPVIATTAGGIPSLVTDGVTGYLTWVDDAAAMAEWTLALLRDANLRQTIGLQARQVAQGVFFAGCCRVQYSCTRPARGWPALFRRLFLAMRVLLVTNMSIAPSAPLRHLRA